MCSCVDELEAKLQFERERREALEADMDQMRKQLQHSVSQLQKYQAVSSPSQHKVGTGVRRPVASVIDLVGWWGWR